MGTVLCVPCQAASCLDQGPSRRAPAGCCTPAPPPGRGQLASEAPSATWPGGGPCAGPLPLQGQLAGPCLSGTFSPDPAGAVNHVAITRSCGQLSLSLASLHPLKGSLWSPLSLVPALASAGREARADTQLSFQCGDEKRQPETGTVTSDRG